ARVLLVDDVLATGGTMKAAKELVEMAKAEVVSVVVIGEIGGLGGRDRLPGVTVTSLLQL
ncbi:MAG: phosphoribosyltransferase family protein, partial [Gemmatimonadaceae bacterium]